MGEPLDFFINSVITRNHNTVCYALYREKAFVSSSDGYKDDYRCLTKSNSNS